MSGCFQRGRGLPNDPNDPTIYWTTAPGQRIRPGQLSTGELIGALNKQWGSPADVQKVARMLRARFVREGRVPYGPLLHRLNRADPPPCRCGKPGLYIVGADTFCRACRPLAVVMRHGLQVQQEQRQAELVKKVAEIERDRKVRDGLRRARLRRRTVPHP